MYTLVEVSNVHQELFAPTLANFYADINTKIASKQATCVGYMCCASCMLTIFVVIFVLALV